MLGRSHVDIGLRGATSQEAREFEVMTWQSKRQTLAGQVVSARNFFVDGGLKQWVCGREMVTTL
jgi:hypothetical protein